MGILLRFSGTELFQSPFGQDFPQNIRHTHRLVGDIYGQIGIILRHRRKA